MTDQQPEDPYEIRATRLGMESRHFRIVVCGLEQSVMLGAFPTLAEVTLQTGVGFLTETPFAATVGSPWEKDFPNRAREAAMNLLERAERESEDWCRELGGPRHWQKAAEDALHGEGVRA